MTGGNMLGNHHHHQGHVHDKFDDQEEQNDPLPCVLLCLDEFCLRMKGGILIIIIMMIMIIIIMKMMIIIPHHYDHDDDLSSSSAIFIKSDDDGRMLNSFECI